MTNRCEFSLPLDPLPLAPELEIPTEEDFPVVGENLPELIDVSGPIELGDLEPGSYVAEVEISGLPGDRGHNKATSSARFNIVDIPR